MPKVSREEAQANREALVDSAGQLFRERGINGVGVAELCNAAGMTHGALYSHFGSKDELAAEAFALGLQASERRMVDVLGIKPSTDAIIRFYISRRQRDNLVNCCPMLATASEAARQTDELRKQFAEGFRNLSKAINESLDGKAVASCSVASSLIAAAMIGIVAVARALKSVDPQTSDRLIAVSPSMLANIAPRPKPALKKAKSRRIQKRRLS